jgi:hypothetical protein
LSVLVDVGGEEVLIDPGTCAYYDEGGRRNAFRSTWAHNTLEIGGHDQADPFDPFKWANIPRTGIEMCHFAPAFDYVEAWHDGYTRLRPPARHRRAVLGVAGGWLLVDWIEGHGEHQFVRWFHAPPNATVEHTAASCVRVTAGSERRALTIRDLLGPGESDSTRQGSDVAPYSERYGECRSSPVIFFADTASLPAMRLTLLTPARSGRSNGDLAARVEGARTDGAVWVRLAPVNAAALDVVVRTAGATTRVGPLETDARLVVAPDGCSIEGVFTSGGSYTRRIDAR